MKQTLHTKSANWTFSGKNNNNNEEKKEIFAVIESLNFGHNPVVKMKSGEYIFERKMDEIQNTDKTEV